MKRTRRTKNHNNQYSPIPRTFGSDYRETDNHNYLSRQSGYVSKTLLASDVRPSTTNARLLINAAFPIVLFSGTAWTSGSRTGSQDAGCSGDEAPPCSFFLTSFRSPGILSQFRTLTNNRIKASCGKKVSTERKVVPTGGVNDVRTDSLYAELSLLSCSSRPSSRTHAFPPTRL